MKFKLVYIVHLIILLLVGYVYYLGIIKLIDFLKFDGFNDSDFSGIIYQIKASRSLYASILITCPLIGVFLRNRTGWVFISYYLYFIICLLFFFFFEEGLSDFRDTIPMILLVLPILFLLIIMNAQKVSCHYYKIKKDDLSGINIISFVIGYCVAFIFYLSNIPEHLF